MNRSDVLAVLATFTTVRKRMISRVNVKETVPSLQSLARDAVLLGLIETNPERLVSEVVAKLGEMDITAGGRELLLATVISYLLWIQEIFQCNYFRTRIRNFDCWSFFFSTRPCLRFLTQGK